MSKYINKTKIILCFILLCINSFTLKSQNNNKISDIYEVSYNYINDMLLEKTPISFKDAVFATENAYYDGNINIKSFDQGISALVNIVKTVSNLID
jgi:hypothetical protein